MNEIFLKLTAQQIFTLGIYGEAEGEPIDGQAGVASVMMNRLGSGRFGKSIHEVILQPKQFSCLNEDAPRRKKLEDIALRFDGVLAFERSLRACWWIAGGFLDNWIESNVGRALFYHTNSCNPTWDDKMLLVTAIGKHNFYVERGK